MCLICASKVPLESFKKNMRGIDFSHGGDIQHFKRKHSAQNPDKFPSVHHGLGHGIMYYHLETRLEWLITSDATPSRELIEEAEALKQSDIE